VRSLNGRWRPQYTPKLKKRTALLRQLRELFWRYRSQPVQSVVTLINPILRGWVNYFAIGHSSRCFQLVKRWVELKIRRHLRRARNRRGFGWRSGVPRDCTPRLASSMAITCVRLCGGLSALVWSHNPCCEAHTRAQCDNPACCVRCGGDWKRGGVHPPTARQSSTLPPIPPRSGARLWI